MKMSLWCWKFGYLALKSFGNFSKGIRADPAYKMFTLISFNWGYFSLLGTLMESLIKQVVMYHLSTSMPP